MALDVNPNPTLNPLPTTFRWPEPEPKSAPKAEPDYRWEGPMAGLSGTARALRTVLLLTLRLRDGAVTGEGHADPWPRDCPEGDRQVEVTGGAAGEEISFTLTFPTSPHFKDKAIQFSGAFAANRTEIHGTWAYKCPGCACQPSTGALTLTRAAG